MRIPDYKIDEIRSANDIVEVISSFVQLKRRGKNFLGLCPFHKEKTPSFTVSPDKQMYHCFGCGKGGNIYTFVMEMEKVTFVEAVRSLAERAGITIQMEETSPDQASESENLYQACRFAGLHFYKNLTESAEGKFALKYFHDREFSDDTIRVFGLGYSLNSWDGLLVAAQLEGIPVDHLVKAGLVRSREDGSGHYDYFRGRAMFPIFSTSGRVIAFGARKLREDDSIQGKYINSPETPVYSKSRVVFGLFQSKEAVRSENNALIVEGYADTISLFQAGVQNVVASSGTALTPDQLRLVRKYAKSLTLVYDADSAGSQATVRGVDLALEHGFDVKIVPLPKGEDPDSFVRKNGPKEFRQLLLNAVSFIDFKATQFLNEGSFSTPEGKTAAVRSIVQSIAKIGDELKRNFFVKEVADRYGIYESVLYRELERWIAREKPQQGPVDGGPNRSVPESPLGQGEGTHNDIPSAERDILKVLFENQSEAVSFVAANLALEELTDQRVRKLTEMALQAWQEVGTIDAALFVNQISDEGLKSILSDIVVNEYSVSGGWQDFNRAESLEIAKGAIATIKRANVEREVIEIRRILNDAHRPEDELLALRQRWHELSRYLKGSQPDKTTS